MDREQVLAFLDAEIDRLSRARQLLSDERRSVGSVQDTGSQQVSAAKNGRKRKRFMSAEARKRISDAQKKRWAAQRKAR